MMKRSMRQFFIFVLILSLVMSNFAFAGVKEFIIEDNDRELPTGIDIKISEGLKNQGLEENDIVRLIVELKEEPVIKYATKQGIQVVDMDSVQMDSIVNTIVSEQTMMLNQLESNSVDVEVLSTYNSIFNGIAMTARFGDIEMIASLDNVKRVSISKQYALPEPQMNNSSRYTKADMVNDEYGYKGEGIVVSIIDSGIDYNHQDMKVDPETGVALSEADVIGLGMSLGLPGQFYTEKVPYGYNYIDKNLEIRDFNSVTGMHGMHVAGTVAANGDIMGVAPNAQLLAMKVFSNDISFASTYGDILVAAMDDSIKLGADVMNLSIGATAQWVDPLDPEQVAVRLATENGIVMSISAGNSAFFGNGSNPNFPFAENPDLGVVGSPGLSNESIQVASIDNYSELYELNVDVEGLETSVGYGADRWEDKTYELVTLGNKMGAPEDYDGIDVKGKVVLVSRGAYSFFDKTINAENKGAVGIIVYNNDPSRTFYKNQGGWGTIPFMKIHQPEGLALEEATKDGPVTITVSLKSSATNPTSGSMSSFSSWGSTPNLDFKPEITAPGGNIYSTLNDNKYGAKSGTSMAAPHVSGGAALIAQRLNEDSIFPMLVETEKSLMIKNILMNTATPIVDTDTYVFGGNSYVSVRQQGAGSMNLMNASKTTVVITEEDSNVAKVVLGEVTDSIDFTLRVKNYGTEEVKYNVAAMAQMNSSNWGYNLLGTEELAGITTMISVDGQPLTDLLTVAPKGEMLVRFEMDLTNVTMLDGASISSKHPNGNYIEGFALFNYHDESLMGDKDNMKAAYDALKAEYDALMLEKAALMMLAEEKATDVLVIEEIINDLELEMDALDLEYADTILLADAYALAESAYNNAVTALEELKAAHPGLSVDRIAQLGTNKIEAESVLTDLEAELVVLVDAAVALLQTQTDTATAYADADEVLLAAKIALGVLEAADPVDEAAVAIAMVAVEDAETALADALTAKDDAALAVVENMNAQTDKQAEIDAQIAAIAEIVESIETGNAVLESIASSEQAVADALIAKDTAALSLTDDVKADYTEYTTKNDALVAEYAAAVITLVAARNEQETADADLALKTTKVEMKMAAMEMAFDNYDNATNVYYDALPLSVPFLGFLGDFGDAPAFDQPMYESRSFYGMTNLVNENGEFLGQNGMTSDDTIYNKEWIAMSPNDDGINEQIVPVVSLLRNLKDMEFKILSEDKVVLRTLGMGVTASKDYYDGVSGRQYSYFEDYAFDGKANLNVLPEGQYYYEISGRLDDQDKTLKSIMFPFKIDVTAPGNIEVVYTNGAKELEVSTDEDNSGVKMFYLVNDEGEVLAKSMTSVVDISDIDLEAMNVRIVAVDFAGNEAEGDLFIVNDGTKPVVDITLEALATFNTSVIAIEGTITDMTDITLTVNDVLIPTVENDGKYEFSKDFTFAPDGKHSIVVVATDEVNNKIEFMRDFFVDTMAPVITVTSDDLMTDEGIQYVANEMVKVAFDAHIKDTQFPRLTVRYNGDVVFQESPEFESYNNLMGDVETTFSREVDLVEGPNRVLIEAVDAGGNVTTYDHTVYRLAYGEEAPTNLEFVKEEIMSHEFDIANGRPVFFKYETNETADWTLEVMDSDGDLVDTLTFTDTMMVDAQWSPDAKVKTGGMFTVKVTAVKGGSTIMSMGTFKVYNYPVKVISTRHFQRGSMLIIEAEVRNLDMYAQTPLIVVQIKKADGTVMSIITSQAKVTVGDVVTLSAGIQMPEGGAYVADIMVWDEWDMPSTLSDSAEYMFTIN